MNRTALTVTAALVVPALVLGGLLISTHVMNPGQVLCWLAFFASLTAGLSYLAVLQGRKAALPAAHAAFRIQWAAMLSGVLFLWWILFHHQFQYQYVHDYSSLAMPLHFVYAAFWGGQEGTFLLWAFITASLGLILMRWKHENAPAALFFLNLPLVMLTLVCVMRGPFLPSDQAYTDGVGLNPLLQDYWMTIHPPVLFTGFSSFVVPFAIACAALLKRDYDGWIKPALPWVVFSTAIQATGFIMGGVWAYKVLGWGGYWGWDPVENGSFIPWLCNVALLHGLLVQRVTGSLRKTNFFLAITSYVLVLYASFLTRSGVLADFSVHSFANLGLSGFLLSFLGVAGVFGYGLLIFRLRDIPNPQQPLGNVSRESFLWLGQLVFMLMCALVTVGMSAPLITRLFGPPSNVQTSYYNLVNAPLAVALGLLLGIAPLLRWRKHDVKSMMQAALPSVLFGVVFALLAYLWGVKDALPALIMFAMAFAFAANLVVTIRGFRTGWKHGVAFLGHMGVSILLIGIISSSNYGRSAQVQLPKGEPRSALGYKMTFQGMTRDAEGKDAAIIAVSTPERAFTAKARFYWSEFNQGYMKKPHIERFATHDIYISPQEMIGDRPGGGDGIWLAPGESKLVGQVKYTFEGFTPEPQANGMKLIANLTAETGGRTVPLHPVFEVGGGGMKKTPDYIPGGGAVNIISADPQTGKVQLELPGSDKGQQQEILAVEVSTKPFINLVWVGAIVTLASAFLSMFRRIGDARRPTVGA